MGLDLFVKRKIMLGSECNISVIKDNQDITNILNLSDRYNSIVSTISIMNNCHAMTRYIIDNYEDDYGSVNVEVGIDSINDMLSFVNNGLKENLIDYCYEEGISTSDYDENNLKYEFELFKKLFERIIEEDRPIRELTDVSVYYKFEISY